MQLEKLWARSLALCLGLTLAVSGNFALTGAALADAAPVPATSGGADAGAATVDGRLSSLFGQEHTALAAVPAARIEAITTPPTKAGAGSPSSVQYTEAWIDAQPVASGGKDWNCLAKAIYFESRGESVKGEFAVGEVVANRADSPDFPGDICAVVNSRGGGACAFSYVCDGQSDAIREPAAWERAGKIAKLILDGAPRTLTDGATYFHTSWSHPGWSHRFEETAQIGSHVFYRDPVQLAAN